MSTISHKPLVYTLPLSSLTSCFFHSPMASPSPKHFLLTALFIASLAHARESQFFSKATKESATTQVVPIKQQQPQQETLYKQQDQQQVDEPNFIPDTNPNGYGLYGHGAGQLPPSATATTTSTVPEESLYSNYEQNNGNYEQYKSNGENRYYYNKDSYVTDEERAGALGNRYTATTATLGDRNTLYGGGDAYVNVKREGMSDTRFLENGKYFYDVNNEEKYYPNRYENARTTASRSGEYSANMVNRGYVQNNYKNPNYEYSGNSMEGYGQNQEEFQEVQDEFVP